MRVCGGYKLADGAALAGRAQAKILGRTARLSTIGDSLFDETGNVCVPRRAVASLGCTMVSVSNIGGTTSAQCLSAQVPLMARLLPDAVVVLTGGNDFGTLTTAETIANLKKIGFALQGMGVWPVMCSYPPTAGTSGTAANIAKLAVINRALYLMCARYGWGYVPVWEVVSRADTATPTAAWVSDGTHYNATGEAALATVLAGVLSGSNLGVFNAGAVSDAEVWQAGYDGANMVCAGGSKTSVMVSSGGADTMAGLTANACTGTVVAPAGSYVKGKWFNLSKSSSSNAYCDSPVVTLNNGSWSNGETLVFAFRARTPDASYTTTMQWSGYDNGFAATYQGCFKSDLLYAVSGDHGEICWAEVVPPNGATTFRARLNMVGTATPVVWQAAQWTVFNKTRLQALYGV